MRRKPRFELRTVRDRITFGVAAASLGVLLLGIVVVGRAGSSVRSLERRQYAGLATDVRLRLDGLASRDRSRLMQAAFSDDLYQMMAKGLAQPDSFIRPAFADRFPTLYGDRFVGVFDLSGRPLYAWTDPGHGDLAAIAVNKPLFRVLDNREPAVGLIRQNDRLYWVGGTPVLPTNYADASQPIRGYLVVVQPFSATAIAPSAGDRPGRFTLTAITPPSRPFQTQVSSAGGRDSVRIDFVLPDIFAQQNTLASFITSRADFRSVQSAIGWAALVGVILTLGLAAAAWYAAMRWLGAPTVRLGQALAPVHHGEMPSLIGSVSSATDWTTVTAAVNRLIANARSSHERFERLTGGGRDGLWERDLTTGDWTVNTRFKELVSYRDGEFPTPLAALAARLEPTAATRVIAWLGAESPSPAMFSLDAELRRPGAKPLPIRIEGARLAESPPGRLTGRVADISEQRDLEIVVDRAVAARRGDRVSTGRFLKALAAGGPVTDPASRRALDLIGATLTGSLGSGSAPFDLFGLLQGFAAGADHAELVIGAGVPERAEGDRALVAAGIEGLLAERAPRAVRRVIRAEQPDRRTPDRIRFSVEDRGLIPAADRLAAIDSTLRTGDADSSDPLLHWHLVHHLAEALDGEAGCETADGVFRRWLTVPLRAIAPEPAPAESAPIVDAVPPWENGSEQTTFELEPAKPTAPRPSGREAKVELVADATVTISLDEASKPPAPPVGDGFRSSLASGRVDAVKIARMTLAELPVRLAELSGAAKAGEIRSLSEIAQTIGRLARGLDAAPLGGRCDDLVDAIDNQYLDSADERIAEIGREWSLVEAVIKPLVPRQPERAEPPAIDPATLEQLSASLADGAGLGSQLVSMFLKECPSRIEAIERAAGSGDWTALKAGAGDLKGICALIGADQLAARCAAAADSAGPSGWTEAMAIRSEWERVQKALDGLTGVKTGA